MTITAVSLLDNAGWQLGLLNLTRLVRLLRAWGHSGCRALLRLLSVAFLSGIVGVASADEDTRARNHYRLHCVGCHVEDGSGLKGQVPSLRDELQGILATPQGRDFIMRVPGVAQSALKSEDLAGLLNWVVAEYGGGSAKDFVPYTAVEVDRARKRPFLDVAGMRARLLLEARQSTHE